VLLEILPGNRGVVIDEVELVSECVGVFHGGFSLPFVVPIIALKVIIIKLILLF
jgi:hypothetical protein